MALGLAMLVGGALPVAAAETHQVTVSESGFEPATLEIKQGDTVEWVWESGSNTITSGDPTKISEAGDPLDMTLDDTTPKENRSYTFKETGIYHYFSRTNTGLVGTITVTGATPVNPRTWGWLKSQFQAS